MPQSATSMMIGNVSPGSGVARPVPVAWAIGLVAAVIYGPFAWVLFVTHNPGSNYLAMLPLAPGFVLPVLIGLTTGYQANGVIAIALTGIATLAYGVIGLSWARRTLLRFAVTLAAILILSSFGSWVMYQLYRW